jgi:transcriptional regulator with XRE-family HTH domain
MSGTRIKDLREKRGVSMRQLAAEVGVSGTQINRYETDQQSPTLPVARRIADFFGVTLDELVAEDES